jgi:hypothetical protein
MKNLESFDISIEEFDEMNEQHTFSKQYTEKKKELLQNYRKGLLSSSRSRYVKAAAVFAVFLVSGPIIANAATDGELFSRIWGTMGKNNVTSHDEVIYDEEKGTSYTVTYPERDYEEVDAEKAEELIGNQVTYPSITREIDGTTLTILSAVRDDNAAVVEFTLEKEGGVDALNYSQLDNEAKGAYFSDEATFWFKIGDGGESIFVDLDKSTNDKLYCYDYMTLETAASNIDMELYEYPCTRGELLQVSEEDAKYEELEAETKSSTINIPISENVASAALKNADGGVVEVSPLSIKIDMNTGLGLTESEAYDPYSCYYVSINYKDGTNYIVSEHEKSGKHSCDVEIDNSSYACGSLNNELTYVFNRLVDTSQIDSVTVNDVEYTLQ